MKNFIANIFNLITRFFHAAFEASGYGLLLRNSFRGFPNSQYELAEFYFLKEKNYIEAFAWAEVACARNHPKASALKQRIEEMLSPEISINAHKKAEEYKRSFARRKSIR